MIAYDWLIHEGLGNSDGVLQSSLSLQSIAQVLPIVESPTCRLARQVLHAGVAAAIGSWAVLDKR